jgi:hypothetical protein
MHALTTSALAAILTITVAPAQTFPEFPAPVQPMRATLPNGNSVYLGNVALHDLDGDGDLDVVGLGLGSQQGLFVALNSGGRIPAWAERHLDRVIPRRGADVRDEDVSRRRERRRDLLRCQTLDVVDGHAHDVELREVRTRVAGSDDGEIDRRVEGVAEP